MACSSVQALQLLLRSPFPSNTTPRSHLHNKHSEHLFFTASSSTVTFKTRIISIENRPKNKKNRGLSSLFASSEGAEGVGLGVEEENPEEIISGEWPENYSLLNYDDLRAYLEPEIFKEKMEPSTLLGDVMSPVIRTTAVDQTLEVINHHFEFVSGLPVIDEHFKCVGVVSKKDQQRATDGGEVMSSPAITLSPDKTVLDAAALMLKKKIHRIPIVNEEAQIVGIVTRTDIFRALEGLPA